MLVFRWYCTGTSLALHEYITDTAFVLHCYVAWSAHVNAGIALVLHNCSATPALALSWYGLAWYTAIY